MSEQEVVRLRAALAQAKEERDRAMNECIDGTAEHRAALAASEAERDDERRWKETALTMLGQERARASGLQRELLAAEARCAVLGRVAGDFVRAHRIISGRPCRCVYCQGFRAALRPASGAGTGTRPPPAGEEM